ncbi:hypothetical protein BDA99DRAFT_445501 [Phascolomyces articulosus]|uniref:Uncharacterized protein n=1 Tax=Phascolomyces articulosus TaxID=60185 RepID=A0AAD5JZT2_9FUNG|nr:hypothetical protein BDA99DRAFT_445501 [Phascolomyces articulosus]
MQSPLHPVYPGPKERRTLYFNCINNIIDVEEWLVGWFMRSHNPEQQPMVHEIRRENLAEWIAWAFFAQPLETVLEDEEATTEMYWMINHFADKFGLDFTPGYDEDIIAFRLTLDPVQAYHRPLVFYLFIISMTYLNTFLLSFWGFKKFGPDIPSALSLGWSTLPSETTTSTSSASTGRVGYWYREGKNPNKKPIVFIHGIGPGLLPYLKFVYHLLDIDAPLFCVEQPYVSMRCIEDVPSMQETVQDLERMLHFHGFRDAVYVSHSLGVVIQTRSSRRRKSQHQNRTIRMPRATKVFLSEHDNIVNSSRVHEYLSSNGVNSEVMEGLDHGWFLFKSAWQQQILDTVSDYASINN